MAITDQDLKKIVLGVGELLEPIHEQIDDLRNIVDGHTTMLEELTSRVDSHTVSLMNIEKTLPVFRDMYLNNKEKNKNLDHFYQTLSK